jgi:predicted nucleotidyltransferase
MEELGKDKLRISLEQQSRIYNRYQVIKKAINEEFWNTSSAEKHCFYVGSYSRNTAISTSDVDILVELPDSEFERFNKAIGNGQSYLLQVVKKVIVNKYPRSDIRADGQVVKINFSDQIKFEILPAFKQVMLIDRYKEVFKYPDSNNGGNWRITDPKSEQAAMKIKNSESNGLLNDTCKYIRFIRDNYYPSAHLSGIVIDSFVYDAIESNRWAVPGEKGGQPISVYKNQLLTYYNSVKNMELKAPGSNIEIPTASSMECLGKILYQMANFASFE